MTNKEKLTQLFYDCTPRNGDADFYGQMIERITSTLSEQQAEALLSLDGSIDVFEDGAKTPPYSVGHLLILLMLNIIATYKEQVTEITPAQISDFINAYTKNAMRVIAVERDDEDEPLPDSHGKTQGAGFWKEIAAIFEDAAAASLKKYSAVYPQTYTFPTTKIHNKLPAISESGKGNAVVEVIKGTPKKQKVTTSVIIDFSSCLSNVTGMEKITALDMSYQNAYITLLLSGNEAITPEMLARVSAGLPAGQDVSERQVEEAKASIEKQMATILQIDAREEAKAYGKKGRLLRENMIYAKYAEFVSINGKVTSAYIPLYDKHGDPLPLLYRYAAISGQIANVPFEMVQIPSISSTRRNIVLRNYLLLQISGMKHGGLSNKIKFSTIFTHLGMKEADSKNWKVETARIRSTVMKMLEYWKGQNFIGGYSTYKAGRAIEGIEIQV